MQRLQVNELFSIRLVAKIGADFKGCFSGSSHEVKAIPCRFFLMQESYCKVPTHICVSRTFLLQDYKALEISLDS